jgi:hypothetical protein
MLDDGWIKVTDKLPKLFENVWIYYRDREVLIGYRTYQGKHTIECPANEGWYSIEDEKCRWTNYWKPIEKPNPPNINPQVPHVEQEV